MLKKLKSLLADDAIYLASLLVLVGVVSFGLGRLSVSTTSELSPQSAAIGLISPPDAPKLVSGQSEQGGTSSVQTVPPVVPSSAPFVASKTSTKFHKVTCPGAKAIKESNKIYFTTIAEAEAAGYQKAANCKW